MAIFEHVAVAVGDPDPVGDEVTDLGRSRVGRDVDRDSLSVDVQGNVAQALRISLDEIKIA